MAEKEAFSGWCILELMGHRRLGGYLTEQEIAGAAFIRIDVPGEDSQPVASQFYAPGAVYCIMPTTEELARAVAIRNQPTPVQRWELPAPKEERRADGWMSEADVEREYALCMSETDDDDEDDEDDEDDDEETT